MDQMWSIQIVLQWFIFSTKSMFSFIFQCNANFMTCVKIKGLSTKECMVEGFKCQRSCKMQWINGKQVRHYGPFAFKCPLFSYHVETTLKGISLFTLTWFPLVSNKEGTLKVNGFSYQSHLKRELRRTLAKSLH